MPTLRDVANFLGLSSERKMAAKLNVNAPVSTLALIKAYEKVPPTAYYKQDKTQGAAPITVQFTDQSIGYIKKREWKFGDGGTDHTANPAHTYQHANCSDNYWITLTVSNDGGSNTAKSSMWVYPPPPKASFNASPPAGPSPLQVTFFETSDAECITSRFWDFGDGHTSTEFDPTHVFTNNTGATVQFRVSLQIQVESNNPASFASEVTVTPGGGQPPPPSNPPYITAVRVEGMDAITVQGYHFPDGMRVRLDVTYPPTKTSSYWSDPVVAGEFTQQIALETCTGNSGVLCTVQATIDGKNFIPAKPPIMC